MRKVFSGNDIAPKQLRLQRGASLLEGIAYLGIAAIVILGAVSLLSGAFNSAQTNRTTEELMNLRTAIQKLYMGQGGGYGTAANLFNNLVAAGMMPGTLAHTTTNGAVTATNAWGGAVTAVGNGATFTITYPSIPQEACVGLLLSTSGWTNVAIGGTTVALPVTPTAAANTCAASNNFTFTAS